MTECVKKVTVVFKCEIPVSYDHHGKIARYQRYIKGCFPDTVFHELWVDQFNVGAERIQFVFSFSHACPDSTYIQDLLNHSAEIMRTKKYGFSLNIQQ